MESPPRSSSSRCAEPGSGSPAAAAPATPPGKGGKPGDRGDRPERPERSDRPRDTQPKVFEARPPREQKIDPDNPFAVLAALKTRI